MVGKTEEGWWSGGLSESCVENIRAICLRMMGSETKVVVEETEINEQIEDILPWPMWLSWLDCHPVNRKFAGSIPGQGTCLGCGFVPQLGSEREATSQCSSPCLSLSLPPL